MASSAPIHRHRELPTGDCLARSVADALAAEPMLEAVTIDRTHRTISVATLGRADEAKLAENLTTKLQSVEAAGAAQGCALLAGTGDCATCAAPLTETERRQIAIQHNGCTTTIARVTCPTAPKFWRWRNLPFPKVVPREVEYLAPDHDDDHGHDHADDWKVQLGAAILCGVFGLTGYFFHRADQPVWSQVAFIAAYLSGGWFPAAEVWERLRKRVIDVHFLMLAVAAGSASIGAWGEGAVLLFLFSLSGALEHYALGRTQKEIRSLFRDAPKVATVLDAQGMESEVKVELLRPGMRLLVRPGSQFPVDAEVLKGGTAADESNLTGEAAPVEKAVGDTVLAGTINLWGAVEVSVLRPAAESALQKIITLIKDAQQQKAPAQLFTDKFSTAYTYFAIGLSLVMFFVWWLGFRLSPFTASNVAQPESSAFYRTMTLLVVSSPCALVLSIPSAVLAAIAWGARHGVLMRGGAAVEKLAEVNVVALDKTGTLTTGELAVSRLMPIGDVKPAELLRIAASAEKYSNHPTAKALATIAGEAGVPLVEPKDFTETAGRGVKADVGGAKVLVGRAQWLKDNGVNSDFEKSVDLNETEGWSLIFVARDGQCIGWVGLQDQTRAEAKESLADLKEAGVRRIAMISGDRQPVATRVAAEIGCEEAKGDCLPQTKVEFVRAMKAKGYKVAVVGDGVNDAPALAAGDIGIAMGAAGSEVAIHSATIALMNNDLRRLPFLVKLSRSTRAVINQNFLFGVLFIIVGLTATAMGYVGPIFAAILHNVGSLIVIFNSARLVRKGEELEHYHPEPAAPTGRDGGSKPEATGQLTPKLA